MSADHRPLVRDTAPAQPSPVRAPAAPADQASGEQTGQRPVSALGWGLALVGGALIWAAIAATLR